MATIIIVCLSGVLCMMMAAIMASSAHFLTTCVFVRDSAKGLSRRACVISIFLYCTKCDNRSRIFVRWTFVGTWPCGSKIQNLIRREGVVTGSSNRSQEEVQRDHHVRRGQDQKA